MAPPRNEDPMAQIMAKNEEGNKETHRRMETVQASLATVEATMKGMMKEQGEFRKWRPEVEMKVTEVAEALKTIQAKVDQLGPSSSSTEPLPDGKQTKKGVPISAQLEIPPVDATNGQFRHRFAENHQRPGVEENLRTPAPVGGMPIPPETFTPFFDWGSLGRNSVANWSQMSGPTMPNMVFPFFDGSNPKLWKHRCETYFDFYAVPFEKWVRIATMHFEGPAMYWVQSMEHRIRELSWEALCATLNTRFGRDQHNLLIRHFYHIHQTNSVAEYVEQFDQLMHQLLAHENHLTSTMITGRFVDGLKDEIKSAVIIQRPSDWDTACSLALLQEDVLLHSGRRDGRRTEFGAYSSRPSVKPTPMPLPLPPLGGNRAVSNTEERRGHGPQQRRRDEGKLSALKAYRKAKGLCFKCGNKWGYEHRCSTNVPLYLVEEMWELVVNEEEKLEDCIGDSKETNEDSVLALSAAAAEGGEGSRTIRLWASVYCQQFLVLVDSGSSASFLGSHLMNVLPGIQLLTKPMQVKVADGGILWSQHWFPNCKWLCGGTTFITDFKFIALGGYDMILGMDWIERHCPMSVHWATKRMEFDYDKKRVHL
jgi:hypothetical protein